MAHCWIRSHAIDGTTAILALFCADLIVRTSYQIGKAPVLTSVAIDLNMAPLFLGTIASISTATGFFLKPVFGVLSDRIGRRIWLIIGASLFSGVPLLYNFVETPGDLVALRLFHGLATAIYGPVTLAYIAATRRVGVAETFGWFGLARTAANIAGPMIGGAALMVAEPESIYTATSFFAAAAFCFLLPLNEPKRQEQTRLRTGLRGGWRQLKAANRTIILIGTVEFTVHIAIYAVKGFAPVLMLLSGGHPIAVGTFLATQEAVAAILRPVMGRLSDRMGPRTPMVLGLILVSAGLLTIAATGQGASMLIAAVLIGSGQGAFGPAALSSVANTVPAPHLGLAYGVIGSLRNAGKIVGPIAAGGLTTFFSAPFAFSALAVFPLIALAPMVYLKLNLLSRSEAEPAKLRDG